MNLARICYVLTFCVVLVLLGSAFSEAQSDFLKYINKDSWDLENVLVLGVGADWNKIEVQDIRQKFSFDMVIPLSDGSVGVDSVKATLAKLGIPIQTMGKLEDLRGKSVRNLYAHSWGSSEIINFLSMTDDTRIHHLHLMGSPESVVFNYALKNSLDGGVIGKAFFHVNDEDKIALLRNLPKITTEGGVSNKVEFHFYKTEQRSVDSKGYEPFIGFNKYFHYNCLKQGHALLSYLENMIFATMRDPDRSAFPGEGSPPFHIIPSYFVLRNVTEQGKSMTEARTLTEMVHDKRKAIIVGKGPEADLMYKNMVEKLGERYVRRIDSYTDSKTIQLEARQFGADVILGVRDTKPSEATMHSSDRFSAEERGGVFMSPQPESVGKGGSELRDEVLKSKPSGDTLSWPVRIPPKEK